jgi:hypothetical protein
VVIDELIDSPKKYLGSQIATLLATQRALDDNRLEWKLTDTGWDVPPALLAGDDDRLAC